MKQKYITVITLIGDPLSDAAKLELKLLGEIQVSEQQPIIVVAAPPAIKDTEKYHEHQKGVLGLDMLIALINDGITLIKYLPSGARIRIHNGIVRVYQGKKFASMLKKDFIDAIAKLPHAYIAPAIGALLNDGKSENSYGFRFIQEPIEVLSQVATEMMGWDGSNPELQRSSKSKTGWLIQFHHLAKGSLESSQFIRYANARMSHLNEEHHRFVKITVDFVYIYNSDGVQGSYAKMKKEAFFEAFNAVKGITLRTRLRRILSSKSVPFIEKPQKLTWGEALDRMKWNKTLQELGE